MTIENYSNTHPLVLGTGRRLFPENDGTANLQLKDVKSTSTGVMVATYQPCYPDWKK